MFNRNSFQLLNIRGVKQKLYKCDEFYNEFCIVNRLNILYFIIRNTLTKFLVYLTIEFSENMYFVK